MPGPADRGAVTVEAAIAMSSLVVVTVAAIGSVAAVTTSVRCIDAASELARLAARGEADRGHTVATRLAPTGAGITVSVAGDEVTVEVTAEPVALLPLRVGGRAVAVLEPGVDGSTR